MRRSAHRTRRKRRPLLNASELKCNNTAYRPVMDAVGLLKRYPDQPIAKEGACFDEAERIPLSGVVREEWRKAVVDDKGRVAAARTLGAEPDDRAAKDRAAGPLGFVPTARSDQNAAGWFPANPDMTVPRPGGTVSAAQPASRRRPTTGVLRRRGVQWERHRHRVNRAPWPTGGRVLAHPRPADMTHRCSTPTRRPT